MLVCAKDEPLCNDCAKHKRTALPCRSTKDSIISQEDWGGRWDSTSRCCEGECRWGSLDRYTFSRAYAQFKRSPMWARRSRTPNSRQKCSTCSSKTARSGSNSKLAEITPVLPPLPFLVRTSHFTKNTPQIIDIRKSHVNLASTLDTAKQRGVGRKN